MTAAPCGAKGPMLEISQLVKVYATGQRALSGVDLTVEQQIEMLTFDLAVEVVQEAIQGVNQ